MASDDAPKRDMKNVFHSLDALGLRHAWRIVDGAADASFPSLSTYTGQALTRAQWDELFASYEAATDLAALFATQLMEIYPEAKVILTIRDFDAWDRSFNAVFDQLWSLPARISVQFAEPVLGSVAGRVARKAILGFFEATTAKEARSNMRRVYGRHHSQIRARVAPQQLLEYRMGQGWEPLCRFLDKPIPHQPFPWLNEAEALRERIRQKIRGQLMAAAAAVMPWIAGVVAVALGLWMAATRLGQQARG